MPFVLVQKSCRKPPPLPRSARKAVSKWTLADAQAVTRQALELDTESQVRAWLEDHKRL